MRPILSLCALIVATPLAAQLQNPAGPFEQAVPTTGQPLRVGQVRSAAFLTEMRSMPYGRVLGLVTPPAVEARQSPEMAMVGTLIGLAPPTGATWQRGDTVMLATLVDAPRGWGRLVLPTGLAVVGNSNPRQVEAKVIAMYGQIREGQVTLPISPMAASASGATSTVSGPTGSFMFGRETTELYQLGSELFIDQGRTAGMRLGDVVEFRRRAGTRSNAADMIDDQLALGQVVNVGDKSSTVRLFHISHPAIAAGSPVLRVATLSN